MAINRLRAWRFELVWSAVAGLLAVGLAWVPLFNVLGYEFSEFYCAFTTIAAGAISIKRVSDGTIRPGEQSTGECAVSLIARSALPLLPPLVLILANAIRVPNCAIGNGILLYLLLPLGTVPVVVVLCLVVSVLVGRPWLRGLLYGGIVLLTAAFTAAHLLYQPPIYAFHHTFGYIAGSIYDEALSIPQGLLAFRLMSLALVVGALAGLDLGFKWRQSRRIGPPILVLLTAVAVWTVLYLQRFELRIEATREDLIEALGGRIDSDHFTIYYPISDSRIAGNIEAIAQDHEYRYHQLREFFEIEPVLPVRSFIYSSHEQKGRYMGASRTLIARPWLGEMHITWEGIGRGHMSHELAHLFTRGFGSGPLHLAGGGLLELDMGLVEGAAEAGAWDAQPLTFHGWSAALHRLGLAPDLERIMGAGGFWSQHSRTAYTLMGSFSRWLIDRYGMDRFQRLYATGEFSGVYERVLADLLADWRAYLDGLQLEDGDLERARFLYDRPSIFGKRCARALAARVESGRLLGESHRYDQAARCLERVVEDDPDNPAYRLELAAYLNKSGRPLEARQMALAVYDREGVGRIVRARSAELLGDIAWWSNRLEEARQWYREVSMEPLSSDDRRRVTVKLWALEDEELSGLVFDLLLAAPPVPGTSLIQRMNEQMATGSSPLAAYLLGLQLFNAREYERAVVALEQAIDGLPSSNERLGPGVEEIGENARFQQGVSLYLSNQLEEARRLFEEMGRGGGRAEVDGRTVAALDWVARCDWAIGRRGDRAMGSDETGRGGSLDAVSGP